MSSHPALHKLKLTLLDLLFPLRCLGCGSGGSLLCPACCQSLPRVEMACCQRCGVPLSQGGLCATCSDPLPAIDGIRSLFLFEGTIRQAIHHFKYKRLKALAAPLGQLLSQYLSSSPLPVESLAAVPLHRKRLRERGFNQASLLARELGQLSGLPVAEGWLFRLRDTPSQARAASRDQRRDNVHAAFGCRQELEGKRILLIDDVCTTGATLDACAMALKAAGACSVWGLTVARET